MNAADIAHILVRSAFAMTPKQAFDYAIGRAEYLVSLHDGLLNIRQRRIRRDWKEAFCAVMHWPQRSRIERVDTKDAIVILRDSAALSTGDFSSTALTELLRSAHAMAVSAFDRYVHERVVKAIIPALKSGSLCREQEELSIPATVAVGITKRVADARRRNQRIRPANEIRNALQELLHRKPFQSWREIESAFRLIGLSGLAGKIQTARHLSSIDPLKRKLDKIADRRNKIVHEADLVRHVRAGKIRPIELTSREVKDSVQFLKDLVTTLEGIR